MDRDQGEPDGKPGEVNGRAPLRDAEDADEEQKGADDFVEEGRGEIESAEIARPPAVLPEPAVPTGNLARHDEIEDRSAGNGAEPLRDHVGDEIRRGYPARDEITEAHRRIDMAARDLTERASDPCRDRHRYRRRHKLLANREPERRLQDRCAQPRTDYGVRRALSRHARRSARSRSRRAYRLASAGRRGRSRRARPGRDAASRFVQCAVALARRDAFILMTLGDERAVRATYVGAGVAH